MKLSQNEKSLLFSSTDIPDVFFTEYLPETKGDYVKVYFYMLFLSKYNKEIKINDLSKTLALDFPTVQDAIKYWEDKGILVKKTDGYTLADIQEMEVAKLYSPKVTSSPEDAIKSAQSQYRAKAIENINSQFFQGVMSPSWYNDIDLWFNKYGFDEQVMLALFNYAYDKRALHRNYVQATADAWSKNNIKTFNDLDAYYKLANNIDLTNDTREGGKFYNESKYKILGGHGWIPIEDFSGTLDGDGYAIKGLYQQTYLTAIEDYIQYYSIFQEYYFYVIIYVDVIL